MTNQCQHGQLARVCLTCEQAAEIAQLREYLDAAQRRGEELRAQVAALTENGPPMQRGTTIEGTPWMGTMREVLEDYKSAADTEARWGDEARAEVAGLRSTLADSRAYVERLKKRIDEMMTERDVLIKVLEAMKQDDKDAEMAQLREYLDAAQRRASALGEEAINLRAQRDAARADWVALREDAARYQFLREDFSVMGANIDGNHAWAYRRNFSLRGPTLDAAIDAARGTT